MSFRGSTAMGDQQVATLAQCLPPNLEILHLDFSWCSAVSNVGIATLARSLPTSMNELILDLNNTKVSSDVKNISSSLNEIRSKFSDSKTKVASPYVPKPEPTAKGSDKILGKPQAPFRQMKLLMLGDSNTGKSEFMQKYCRTNDNSSFITSIGIDFKIKDVDIAGVKTKLQIWDTAGQERFRTISPSYFRGAQGVLVLYNISCEQSFTGIVTWVKQIDDSCSPTTQRILIGNLPESDKERPRVISTERGQELANQIGACFFETTPEVGMDGIDDSFQCLANWVAEMAPL
eukprot:TRINITY_DN69003_c0_g1_i1.p1 TRINITY_DN69003_c0_g1~~TRINITY_DN69003_c0_g1_i1.p1  ORF type:complete len:314 (+),score=33.17 TRINITY_DN69003_c0_g1_i1:75-944(+)